MYPTVYTAGDDGTDNALQGWNPWKMLWKRDMDEI